MAKNIRPYLDQKPDVDSSCYVDDMSVIIGDVKLAENVSVWPFAVIRGDVIRFKLAKTVMCKITVCCMSVIKIKLNQMVLLWSLVKM
jgi:carbonic anhydrase/acetyltransferase-like protein (isoleucine patch superfamily)